MEAITVSTLILVTNIVGAAAACVCWAAAAIRAIGLLKLAFVAATVTCLGYATMFVILLGWHDVTEHALVTRLFGPIVWTFLGVVPALAILRRSRRIERESAQIVRLVLAQAHERQAS